MGPHFLFGRDPINLKNIRYQVIFSKDVYITIAHILRSYVQHYSNDGYQIMLNASGRKSKRESDRPLRSRWIAVAMSGKLLKLTPLFMIYYIITY